MEQNRFTSIVLLFLLMLLASTLSSKSIAATASGTVIDESGELVTDVIVTIESFKGKFVPANRGIIRLEQVFPPPQPCPTDAKGVFEIDNITKDTVNWISLLSQPGQRYDVLFIDFQGISFKFVPYMFRTNSGFPFSIEEDNDVEDIKITVRRKMRIRGQVLDFNGEPLSNTSIVLRVESRNKKGTGNSRSSISTRLNAEGNFTYYVNNEAYYTITITYQGQTVKSKEMLIKKGQSIDDLKLKFKGEFTTPKKPAKVKPIPNDNQEIIQIARQKMREGMWAINPANRHAYKKIDCQTPEEALEIAKEHDAHLVTINDKEEQQWILDVFGVKNYWIGCIETDKEGDKKWNNGEPMTYANWDPNPLIPQSEETKPENNATEKIYTVLIGVTGKWQQIRDGSAITLITKSAILEKEDLIIGLLKPDE